MTRKCHVRFGGGPTEKGSQDHLAGGPPYFKAAATGVDVLPALVLTQEDADASLILRLASGHGLDWGQGSGEHKAA